MTSTRAGTRYTASVWVRAGSVGERLNVQVREWAGATLVSTVHTEWRATDTNWHQIAVPLTAERAGASLSFAVYCANLASPQTFSADDFSLISPRG